ncbi:MAG: formyl-CoA transferase, partial [Porticoccaceae bacterium]
TKTIALTDLEALLNDNGVPCGLIYKAEDMLADEHFKARDAIVDVEHPDFGTIKMQNVAPKLSDTPGRINHVGPTLGEHNDYVFNDLLNLSEDVQKEYREKGII